MINIFDFIKFTEELFVGVKNTIGEEISSGYYLIDSHMLSDYVKKCQESPKHNFTTANTAGFLNKCRYFLYPEKRAEHYKADISVRTFSECCVTMFFKRFGVNFSFLRINSDHEKFVEVQKKCIENLFEQVLSWFRKRKSLEEHDFLQLLEMCYCRYRFELYNIDKDYFLNNYEYLLQSELNDYNNCSIKAFHKLKIMYTKSNNTAGNVSYLDEIKAYYKVQMDIIQSIWKSITETIASGKNKIKNSDLPDLSVIATYLLYKNDEYDKTLEYFRKKCASLMKTRNKNPEFYDNILNTENMDLVKFECLLHKFYFYIMKLSQNVPKDSEDPEDLDKYNMEFLLSDMLPEHV